MDADPLDSWDDSEAESERTYQAFDSSEIAPPPRRREREPERERSLETPAKTEARPQTWSDDQMPTGPQTPSGHRAPSQTRRASSGYGSGSGSSLMSDWGGDDDAIPTDEDGNLFGKYRVIRKLGDGGMGSVWLVEHVRLKQPRALKVIKSEVAESETNRLRFEQEAVILGRLSEHPNAVRVYDTGFDRKFAYIEMDFQDGQTLRKRLESGGPMPAEEVLWVLEQVGSVLDAAHRQGIVHRDIKPQNIMVVPDASTPRGERVKVLDFGIAKVIRDAASETFASLTQDHIGVLGTIPYSSPEQLGLLETGQTQAVVDHRSDIYSLGVMLYEMLAGARPFTGTQTKILYDHAHSPPPRFAELVPNVAAGIPPAVEEVVRRCLEKDPAKRPQSVRELLESFRAAVGVEVPLDTILPAVAKRRSLEELPLVIAAPSVGERLAALVHRHRRMILAGLAAAAIVGVVLAAMLLYDRMAKPQRPIAGWLAERGFVQVPRSGLGPGGWPRTIQETTGTPRRRMVLAGTYYLPDGFEADSPAGTDDKTGLPRALIREGRRYVLIDGGQFLMGNFTKLRPKDDKDPITFDRDEGPGHWVTLSSYYMQETEVSIGEFERFCTDTGRKRTDADVKPFFDAWSALVDVKGAKPEDLRGYPATGVSRRMAEAYARWIGGDLPTEAQWEFAARSRGKPQRYGWGDDPKSVEDIIVSRPDPGPGQVDYDKESDSKQKDVTEQGIYNMAGNVREWCRDAWGIYSSKDDVDPLKKPAEGGSDLYLIRGGSYETTSETARATWRSGAGVEGTAYTSRADGHEKDLGFRVVLEVLERRDPAAPVGPVASQETRP